MTEKSLAFPAGLLIGLTVGVATNSFTNQVLPPRTQLALGGLLVPAVAVLGVISWIVRSLQLDTWLAGVIPGVHYWRVLAGRYFQGQATNFVGWVAFIITFWWLASRSSNIGIELAAVILALAFAVIYYRVPPEHVKRISESGMPGASDDSHEL